MAVSVVVASAVAVSAVAALAVAVFAEFLFVLLGLACVINLQACR